MKLLATIFSWLGGAFTSLVSLFALIVGNPVVEQTESGFSLYFVKYPLWVWIMWGIIVFIRFSILVYRQLSVKNGKNLVPGILTLIFASLVGGLLTLLIPQKELNKGDNNNND